MPYFCFGIINANKGDMGSLYCKSKWTAEQLNGKTVQFLLANDGQRMVLGIGSLTAVENGDHLTQVCVREIEKGHSADTNIYTYHSLSQEAVNKIEQHSRPEIADFILIHIDGIHSSYLNTFVFPK